MTTWTLPDVRNREELSATLIQILMFVENINSVAVEELLHAPKGRHYVARFAVEMRRSLVERGSLRLASSSQWLQILDPLGYKLEPAQELVDRLVRRLVRPDRIVNERGPWTLDPNRGRSHRRLSLAPPIRLSVVLHALDWDRKQLDFATRDVGFPISRQFKKVIATTCDDALNPMAVIEDFLIAELGIREECAEHFVQTWLRSEFDLHYTTKTKALLHSVCREINAMFYASDGTNGEVVNRPPIIGVASVIERIRRVMERGLPEDAPTKGPDSYRQAVGVFLGLRLCGLFRHQTSVAVGIEDKEFRAELDGDLFRVFQLRSCVSTLRRAESGFIRTRLFGALTGVPGLKTVFRGGLLPHPDQGRAFVLKGAAGSGKTVFALKMVADAAYRGRLGIYISVEENLSAIADRLMSFGMLAPAMFDVIYGQGDMSEEIARRRQTSEGKGLLVLYALSGGQLEGAPTSTATTDPVAAIKSIAEGAGDEGPWKWRVVVLDSLNALELHDRATPDERPSSDVMRTRIGFYQLAEAVDVYRFWAIFIAETGDLQLESLSYVVDTVIELGINRQNYTRWMRIDKCRAQAYQPGEHHFRISESEGIRVYPSLNAVQSSLRRKKKSTLSQADVIPLPQPLRGVSELGAIRAKSSVLIAGADNTGKSSLMLHLLTAPLMKLPPKASDGAQKWSYLGHPRSVLVVTFRTSAEQYRQRIRYHPVQEANWNRVGVARVRYFSPGTALTAGQLVSEIRRQIMRAQRESLPIERIAFDEVDAGAGRLPACAEDPLLWHTLTELGSAEAITSFFVLTTTQHGISLEDQLRMSCDYAFETSRREHGLFVTLKKTPDPNWAIRDSIPFALSIRGDLVGRDDEKVFAPDGRRLGVPIEIDVKRSFGRCALRYRNCLADDEPQELWRVVIPPASCLDICKQCLDMQIDQNFWVKAAETH